MNHSIYISSSALHSFQRKLDTVSNNVANLNTVGYKKREATFAENLSAEWNNQIVQDRERGRLTPYGLRAGSGVHLGLTRLSLEQGSALETGNPFDLMIEGRGFFAVGRASDANQAGGEIEIRFTRDGSFRPSPASEDTYYLVNSQGDRLLDEFGDPIEIDRNYDVKIFENGTIQLVDKNDPSILSTAGQRLALFDITHPQLLQNTGDNQYVIRAEGLPEGAAPEDFVRVIDMDAADNPVKLRQGFLETSNVDLIKEMSELIISQRGYQLNARAVSYADQMMGIANGIMK